MNRRVKRKKSRKKTRKKSRRRGKCKVEYTSTFSDGKWWMSDNDWYILARSGWNIRWYRSQLFYKNRVDYNGKYDGVLASKAVKMFNSLREGIEEWEELLGYDSSEKACDCCSPPHKFICDGVSVQGAETIRILASNKD